MGFTLTLLLTTALSQETFRGIPEIRLIERPGLAGIPVPGGIADLYMGNNFDWDDGWGNCIREDHRKHLPNKGSSRVACLAECDKQTWNGKSPKGCEYSSKHRSCHVVWGESVGRSLGGDFRCNLAYAKEKDYLNGGWGTYNKACTRPDVVRGCTISTVWGKYGHSKCTCTEGQYACADGKVASGVGSTTRESLDDCKKRFEGTGKSFVYYEGSKHCQETKGANAQANSGWKLCSPATTSEENAVGQYTYSQQEMSCYRNGCVWEETWCDCMLEAESRAVVNSGGSSSTFTTITHIFAAVGLSAMLYGSFRYYTGKN